MLKNIFSLHAVMGVGEDIFKVVFFLIAPHVIGIFLANNPLPPPHPVLMKKSKYGPYDEKLQRFKLRTKGDQSFTDFCIACVKERLLKPPALIFDTGAMWPHKFNNKMQSSLQAHASEKTEQTKKSQQKGRWKAIQLVLKLKGIEWLDQLNMKRKTRELQVNLPLRKDSLI